MGLQKFAAAMPYEKISETMQPVMEAQFNARIQIVDPNISAGTFNRTTRTMTGRAATVLWEGPARIQAMRWPNMATGKGETVALRTVVFKIPREIDIDLAFIREGLRVEVVNGGMSPEFVGGLFVITSSVNGSYAWDRRIETSQDQGA